MNEKIEKIVQELLYPISQSFKTGEVEWIYLDHEDVWMITHKWDSAYITMECPYYTEIFLLAYEQTDRFNGIQEITRRIPLNRLNEKTLIKAIKKVIEEKEIIKLNNDW